MWNTKYFKQEFEVKDWIKNNSYKYQCRLIFVEDGFGVEYRELRSVY